MFLQQAADTSADTTSGRWTSPTPPRSETKANKGKRPLAVWCDNSRDLEMIPSSPSDFNLYGGIYRYVNLVYVPAISLERVHIETKVESGGRRRPLSGSDSRIPLR